MRTLNCFLALLGLIVAPAALAQEETESETAGENGDGPRPYAEVITGEAVSDDGLFTVHRIGDDYYYEIPANEIDREFLWVGRMSRTIAGQGFGGQKTDTRVVRWEHRGDRMNLRNVSYEMVAQEDLPIAEAVEAANNDIILKSFDVEAYGENESVVINVTPLFAEEVIELGVRGRLQAQALDNDRSYVERITAFPENIEVRAVHTYTRPPANSDEEFEGMAPGSATLEMAYSMVKLPEDPMMPRLYDDRVGYFSVTQTDFGTDEHRSAERRYITRWRLEKQDPDAEVSDPVQPIAFYVDPATPEQWIPYIKQGVEDWQPAFEAAGFSNAIVALDAPSAAEDPDWSPEDARYSVIRWLASEVANAQGPHVHDPRTGEILESDIQFHHNVQSLLTNWYFVQVAPLDERARTLPLPDELMGELLRYVVAHEVGHTLGFQHNMKASSTYPLENVRDPDWVSTMSHTPTLMDYSRFNYVAQPEDNIDPADLIPGIGPYDIWATRWGYMPIESASTPDEELETLNQWALEQEDTPWYRFSTADSRGSDPGELTEAVGDANAIQATTLGLRNLERVMDILLEATEKEGRNWDELENMYGQVIAQWTREMNHVGALVGGFESRQVHGGQDDVRFEPVEPDRQREAVRFLLANALSTPELFIRPEILRRIEPAGVLDRVRGGQRSVLNFLMDSDRFSRLVEQDALDEDAYVPTEFLADLQSGIWSELEANSVATDPYRRNTQRLYLELIESRLGSEESIWNDMRAFLRGQLRDLDREVAAALARASDTATRYHLEDVRDQIALILDPTIQMTNRSGSASSALQDPFNPYNVQACWIDVMAAPGVFGRQQRK